MNLKQLETFSLVADLGSLSRAARMLDTSQSLLSRQIAQLESEWGDKLFERTGRGVVLSDFGRSIQPEVHRLLEQARRLESAVKETAGVPTGTVRVGIFPSMSRPILPLLFDDIRARAPAVRLDIIEGFSGSLDEHMESGRLDMAVINRYGSMPDRGEDILGHVETFLVGKPGQVSSDKPVLFRDLADVPLVLPAMPNSLRSILNQLARQRGVRLDIALEVDTLGAMKNIAASGSACTILTLFAIDEEIAAGKLAASRIVQPGIKRLITLALTRHRPLSRAARLVAMRVRELTSRWLEA